VTDVGRMIKLAHPMVDEDEQRAVIEALASGQLAQGPRVAAFEAAFAAYVGVKHAVAVNSGTAALHVALLAHAIGDADEVIVPAFSFAATANVVLQAGATPVFVDVRGEDFGIDVDAVAAAITPRTRAVIAVHLYGQMCDAAALRTLCTDRDIVLIEDAAQAVGAAFGGENAGTFGTGCFSFYATKNLQTGEGGMVTTHDDAIAERLRMLRSQGERTRYLTEELGWNYRMTEVAAALGHAQLPKLDVRNERRRANAARLSELLAPAVALGAIVTPTELPGRRHVWHQYTIRISAGLEARDTLQVRLRERGIEAGVFYPLPIHRQPLYQRLGYADASMPVAELLCGEVLSLPVHPTLAAAELESIATAVAEATPGS
jgi:perosamine synthetase